MTIEDRGKLLRELPDSDPAREHLLPFGKHPGRILTPMAQIITRSLQWQTRHEALRRLIVCGCALALIAAGQA